MIGSDEMSSTTSMDISETFRPEDLSKTDFFDFVTAPDMGIGIGVGHDRPPGTSDTNGTTNDPALDGYDQFWSSEKDSHSRLESTIFEDLDRYCWQQQQQQQQHHHQHQQQHHHQQQPHHQSQQQSSQTSAQPSQQQQHQQPQQQSHHQSQQQQLPSPVALTASSSSQSTANNSQAGGSLIGSVGSTTTIVGGNNTNDNTDGQIYTLTVLNGNEPWIKRDPDAQLAPSLDLDSLLGSFPGYIKSEYPYDDSGFSTDGTKDAEQVHQSLQPHHLHSLVTQSTIPPVTTIATTNSTTQLAQFQNNNNDWHMADNNTEQNSAESLLRSALQGKGYSKGLHLQNGITLLPPSSVKDEELRRALFHSETDPLSFADTALAAQIFDDSQGLGNSATSSTSSHSHVHVVAQSQLQHQQQQQSTNSSNSSSTNRSRSTQTTATTTGIIVDDMFLSLETAFTNEFEKIKRIANEVQQFCTASDYPEVIMEITGPSQNCVQLQPPQPPQPPPPPQPLQPEVSTSSNSRPPPTGKGGGGGGSKKYKRSNLNPNNRPNNNNNNSHIANNNNPSNTTSPTHCNGQRKERSLHYCSICSKGFKDKYSVNVHIRTHTGEKPFACSLCGKSFRQKAHLAKHYQTHLAQKSNGSVVKGGSKHQRSSGAVPALAAQQRQISPNTPTPPIPNGPSQPSLPTLPPANGLLANR
ncbi:probable basic-leucine zipper transcription factor D [Eupeodes corollae]|uniref:probable basic-leucine zipper transcription factor D n=1 Tax=Eupeodes corollae TaxID=290404 RepID=UPI002493ACA3|nr:probable basic-leucine zipper transcription factor D [Eupeodes corollae]XP_055923490.1 probable basic-leucine zipper transcription factor D [Eupeodes corollae]